MQTPNAWQTPTATETTTTTTTTVTGLRSSRRAIHDSLGMVHTLLAVFVGVLGAASAFERPAPPPPSPLDPAAPPAPTDIGLAACAGAPLSAEWLRELSGGCESDAVVQIHTPAPAGGQGAARSVGVGTGINWNGRRVEHLPSGTDEVFLNRNQGHRNQWHRNQWHCMPNWVRTHHGRAD